jgi:hypothetical protein
LFKARKYLLLATSILWVWSVYQTTIGMRGNGTQNIFLTRTYIWLCYCILSVICFGLFITFSKDLPHKFVTFCGIAICAITLVLQLMSPIGASTDYYRYIWQGRVSNAGQANYALVPWDAGVEKANRDLFERMDWRDVKSVYPPLAEQYFRVPASIFDAKLIENTSIQTRLSFSRLPNLLLFMLSGFLVYKITKLKNLGLVWLSFPFVQFELINSAHVDILAITFVLGALYLLMSKKLAAHMLAGGFIAAAGMVKLVPFVLILPILAYIYVNYSLKRSALAAAAFVTVIGLTIKPFIDNGFALTKRLQFWLSGNEFSLGNPLYEIAHSVLGSAGAGVLKVLGLSACIAIVVSIISNVNNMKLSYSTMLTYGFLLMLIPFISSPIILPWYWLTPLLILLIYRSRTKLPFKPAELLAILITIILLLTQYIDRAINTPIDSRQVITTATSLILYGVLLTYMQVLYTNKTGRS